MAAQLTHRDIGFFSQEDQAEQAVRTLDKPGVSTLSLRPKSESCLKVTSRNQVDFSKTLAPSKIFLFRKIWPLNQKFKTEHLEVKTLLFFPQTLNL